TAGRPPREVGSRSSPPAPSAPPPAKPPSGGYPPRCAPFRTSWLSSQGMSREESSDPYRRARDEAFADLSPWRKLSVQGADAPAWLGDLVSADIADLAPGRARRSLLLSPTGRVRAEFTVAAREEGYLLLQDPLQPHRLDGVLEPYVLSSAVTLDDRTADLPLISIPEPALAHVSGTNGLGTS